MKANKRADAPPRFDAFLLVDVAFNLWFAYRFFQLWVMPGPTDAARIFYMAILMGFEFIMVHSGVFMAVMPLKWSLIFFVPFYGVFALCFNAMVSDNSILWLYLFVVLNRMRFAFMNKSEAVTRQAIGYSVYAVFVYFVGLFAVAIFAEAIPRMGLTPEYLKTSGYAPSIGGILTDQPETAMCLGLGYYVMLSLYSVGAIVFSFRNWLKRRPPPPIFEST